MQTRSKTTTTRPSKDKALSQPEKFKAMAKEVEADGDEKFFENTLKKIARAAKRPVSGGITGLNRSDRLPTKTRTPR